ncbi:DUF2809 domain-containing protein [Hyunsoonleella sp. SJ7]|uniref:DUF2809 domain-containing protein n=1 Tax=Hyunsoonleella aquatilis TaxID=2762758 RepID=A0A923H7L0_9FLAO|nr:DUF2809 domain-containing protein [Hyunsoonleella aquatilis]MBC3757435.1 DUF2809 domain-containing protein [Hyunsoonleella aquatilis]
MVKSFQNKVKVQFNKTYLLITTLLFIIEALIAIYLKTGFIRYTIGDFLVVILIYCCFKSFLKVDSIKLAIAVFLFALCIELLQLLNILSLLGMEHNQTAILLLGSTFHVSDVAAYFLGVITFLIIDINLISNE